MQRASRLAMLVLPNILGMVLLSGCVGPKIGSKGIPYFTAGTESATTYKPAPYLIQVRDELSVKFYYDRELNEELVVRPDGYISLQLINDVKAAGKTATKLATEITQKYQDILQQPEKTALYQIQAGDELSVKFFYNKGMNEELTVRPDGYISLQLINDVKVAGKTVASLGKEITQKYDGILQQPEAAVMVRKAAHPEIFIGSNILKAKIRNPILVSVMIRKTALPEIFIGGEVFRSGVLTPQRSLTALQAFFQAGGMKSSADINNTVLIRKNPQGQPDVYKLDLEQPANDVVLRNSDIVYVPRSGIASINLFVDQYINGIIPDSLTFAYFYNLNPQSQ